MKEDTLYKILYRLGFNKSCKRFQGTKIAWRTQLKTKLVLNVCNGGRTLMNQRKVVPGIVLAGVRSADRTLMGLDD